MDLVFFFKPTSVIRVRRRRRSVDTIYGVVFLGTNGRVE